jgi:hypothetical protein
LLKEDSAVVDDEEVLMKRDWLATVSGVHLHNVHGDDLEESPCNMLLGNAILHVASLEKAACEHRGAKVVMGELMLDCAECRALAEKFGTRLAVIE